MPVKVCQRRFGSIPSSRTASRSRPGIDAWEKAFSGHSMWRVCPSTSETCGRVAWKSKKFSGSMSANRSASQILAR